MATGDLHNALQQLKIALRSVKYPAVVDEAEARRGAPQQFLPMLHHALLDFSRVVAKRCTGQVRAGCWVHTRKWCVPAVLWPTLESR